MTKIVKNESDLKGLKRNCLIQYNCRSCGKKVIRHYRTEVISSILRFVCKSCATKSTNLRKYGVEHIGQSKKIRKKIKQTFKDKYGVENPMKSKIIRQKLQITNMSKYGSISPFGNKEVQTKSKKSMIDRYGAPNTMQSAVLRNKVEATNRKRYGVKSTLSVPEVQEKIKQSLINNYGVDHPFKSKEIQEKSKSANLRNYGVDNPFKSPEIREKIKQSNLAKYGSEYIGGSKIIRDKIEQTNLRKYGVKYYSQTKEAQMTRHYRYLYDGEKFDSSWELALWIYAKDHDEDIERVEEPFEYYDADDGTIRHYFPDFKYKGELVEVKGDQFMNNGTMINPFDSSQNDRFAAKQQCAIDNGVKFMYREDMMPYINYCRMKFAYKTWFHMYTMQYMWLQWLYNYSFMYDFTPYSTNVFEREGMEFVDCECGYE